MSRIIKFRAWEKNKRIMSKVLGVGIMYESINEDFRKKTGNDNYCLDWENIELMQYTGLKDKEGKDIYEGDILRTLDEKVIVFFNESTASFDIEYEGGDCEPLVPAYGEWYADQNEVVGNIHQNEF